MVSWNGFPVFSHSARDQLLAPGRDGVGDAKEGEAPLRGGASGARR